MQLERLHTHTPRFDPESPKSRVDLEADRQPPVLSSTSEQRAMVG